MKPASDVSSARRLAQRLSDAEPAIGQVVPSTFDSYARVFAPVVGDGLTLTWEGVLHDRGISFTPEFSWTSLARQEEDHLQPLMGGLGPDTSLGLAEILATFISPTERVYYAMWTGYGGSTRTSDATTVVFPAAREMTVYEGTCAEAAHNFEHEPFERQSLRWWPADESWAVGGDIYSTSVIIGGSLELIQSVLSSTRLESRALARTSALTPGDL